MARWTRMAAFLLLLSVAGLFLLWSWLRRRSQEEVILKTEAGWITLTPAARPARRAPRAAEAPAPRAVEGPAPRAAEGPAPRAVEGPADDLRRIAGIGPKISEALQAAGIATFAQLAAADVDRLKQILKEAAIRVADPGTWPEQASLAAAGDWEALERLQGELKSGRRA